MANINYIPYAQQQAEIDRQRKYAQLLQQQASEPLESQQVSGIVVPTSPWLGLTKALQMGLGGYMEGKAAKREAELKKSGQEEAQKYFGNLADYAQGKEVSGQAPVTKEISGYGATGPLPVLNVKDGQFSQAMQDTYETPTKAGMLARMMQGITSENPDIAKYAGTVGTALMPTETKATDLFNKLDLDKLTPESRQKVLQTGNMAFAEFEKPTMTPYQIAELNMRESENKVRAAEAARDNARSDAQLAVANANLKLSIDSRDRQAKQFAYDYPNLATDYAPAPAGTAVPPSGTPAQPTGQPTSKPLSRQDQMTYNAKVEPLNDAAIKLANYKQALNEVSRMGSIAGAGAGRIKAAYGDALAAVRILQNTGVYNPGEAFLLDKVLRDASTLTSIADPTSRDQILAQLEEQFKNLNSKKSVIDQQFQQTPTPLVNIGGKSSGETAAQRAKRLGL
jgi:hypothetical protein